LFRLVLFVYLYFDKTQCYFYYFFVGIVSIYSLQGASPSVLQTISGSLLSAFEPSEVTSISTLQNCVDAFSAVGELASLGYLSSLPSSTITTLADTVSAFVEKSSVLSYSSLNSLSDSNFVDTVVSQIVSGKFICVYLCKIFLINTF
jgi:hypothetical protein